MTRLLLLLVAVACMEARAEPWPDAGVPRLDVSKVLRDARVEIHRLRNQLATCQRNEANDKVLWQMMVNADIARDLQDGGPCRCLPGEADGCGRR